MKIVRSGFFGIAAAGKHQKMQKTAGFRRRKVHKKAGRGRKEKYDTP